MTLCFSYFSVDLSSTAKTTPYISPVTTATGFTEPTKSSEVWARYSLHYQRLFCSVCSFEAVDEFVVAVSRNVFRFTNEDSSCSAKRNTNWTSVGFLHPQAGSYCKRCGTRVFPSTERFKMSQGEVCRGYGINNYSARPLAYVSPARVALKAVYFPAGKETLKAKSSYHKYSKMKQAQDLCLSRAFFSGSH